MATFSVTNTNDSGSGSLRQAILDANALSGKDIINFDGVFADNVTDIIKLNSSLNITDDLSINGTGTDLLNIQGSAFDVSSDVTVDIFGLSITNSSRGINNSGNLTLSNIGIRNISSLIVINNTKGVVTVDSSIISNNSGQSGLYTIGTQIIKNVDGTVTLNNSTISNNGENGTRSASVSLIDNSGIFTINNSNIVGNQRNPGRLINSSGTLTISNSNISNNRIQSSSAIFLPVINIIDNSGTATISNTTINDNQGRGINNTGTTTVNNSTISGNFFNGILNSGTLTVNNSTIVRTLDASVSVSPALSPVTTLGGIFNSGTATVKNSIIADNSLSGSGSPGGGFTSNGLTLRNDVVGNFISNGFNIIGNLNGSTGFNESEQLKIPITDLLDLTLRDNGGRVKSHALVTGSPAINAGLNTDVPADVTDLDGDGDTTEQVLFDGRGSGFARVFGDRVDIGAFEAVVNVINGTPRRDTINGTASDDIITGFKRKDILTGGLGADAFVYTEIRDAGDTITDFEVGIDKIILRQLFESLGLANLNFITATTGGYLGFETQGTNTVVLIDPDGTSGLGRAVKFLTVDNVTVNDLNDAINFAFFNLPSTTPSIFTVTNTNDSGSGSLRQAILDANARFGKDIIKFDGVFADNIPDTITLTTNGLIITDDLSIEGTGAELLTVSGKNASNISSIFSIADAVSMDIVGLTIANGRSSGINNLGILTVNNSTITNNNKDSSINNGSGIRNTGTLTVNNSTISNNSGIKGGGIDNQGTLTVNNSTISGNLVQNQSLPPGIISNVGGGIYSTGSLTINNSTISGNSARLDGGGIYNDGTLPVIINNSTIVNNSGRNGGGIFSKLSNVGTLTVNNSIIAGNSEVPNVSNNNPTLPRTPDVRGNFISNGFNIIGNLNGSTGFDLSQQLKIPLTELLDLTLRDNGGRVKTHALVTGSPAINAGLNADVPADITDLDIDGDTTEQVPFDGRGAGFARISGGRVDVGAFEAVVNVINGTQEGETINGTAGDDIITGFKGQNILTGGDGADAFVFTEIENAGATITDFEVGKDKIVLRQVFESLGLANLNFITATAGGYLGFETQGTSTVVLIDPDGSSGEGRAVTFLTVENVTANDLNNAINFALPAISSIFTITNTNDSGIGSLRQAILDANATLGKDVIKFDGVFADNIPDTITLTSGSLLINDDLVIEGTGADLLTVSGNNANRVFEISGGVSVDIVGLTITNGRNINVGTVTTTIGGIDNQGILTLSNSTISGNTGDGIGNNSILTVNNSIISGNTGRGISNGLNGTFTVSNSIISDNKSSGISNNNTSVDGTNSTISNSIISGNTLSGINGGNTTVNNSTISGNTGSGISDVSRLTVNDSTISGNTEDGIRGSNTGGAGTVRNSNISDNKGSGINSRNAIFTVSNTTISGNTKSGINSGTTLRVNNSTIIGNTESGISNFSFSTTTGTSTVSTVSNSTISGNKGGGIFNSSLGTLTVSNSTITGNTRSLGGGISNSGSGRLTVKNSIIAGNFDNDSTTATDLNSDVGGNFISNGFNIIGNLNGSTGFNPNEQLNVLITEFIDTTLRNNGGSVLTYALVAGSPAIDGGNNADVPADVTDLDGDGNTTEPVPFDGRGVGFVRIVGDRVDIGAFEATASVTV